MHDNCASKPLLLGISPCPNDTYIFEALINGRVPDAPSFAVILADVEALNNTVRRGEPDVCKISLAVLPEILDEYALLPCGGALGRGCGPLLAAPGPLTPEDLAKGRIATPGFFTTANLLLNLHGVCRGERLEMVFDEIMPALARHAADAGLIIHEGRFTYAARGLHLVLDLGMWWERTYNLPLPLGGIVIRRSLGRDAARAVTRAVRASLAHAQRHPEAARPFIRAHAQEMDDKVIDEHIKTFVNSYSMDTGVDGGAAIALLAREAARLKGLPLDEARLFAEGVMQ